MIKVEDFMTIGGEGEKMMMVSLLLAATLIAVIKSSEKLIETKLARGIFVDEILLPATTKC